MRSVTISRSEAMTSSTLRPISPSRSAVGLDAVSPLSMTTAPFRPTGAWWIWAIVISALFGQLLTKNENCAVVEMILPDGSSLALRTNRPWPVQEDSASLLGGTSLADRRSAMNAKVPRVGGSNGVGSRVATRAPADEGGA